MTRPYHRNDNKLHEHEKFLAAGLMPTGLWTMCRSWCADNWSDGFIPNYVVKRFAGRGINISKCVARLVEVGLWEPTEGGWQMHDYDDWNTTRAERDAANAAAAERMRAARAAKSQPNSSQVAAKQQSNRSRKTPKPAGQEAMFGGTDEQEVRTRRRTVRTTSSHAVALRDDPGADRIIASWIDHCAVPPDGDLIGQLGKEIKRLLRSYPWDVVNAAVAEWAKVGVGGPSYLRTVIYRMQNPQNPTRPSTTNQILTEGAALIAQAKEWDRQDEIRKSTATPLLEII